ncbi:MAG: dihydrofolate reductase family protein [Solirubrobacterales bacterium]
MRELIVNTFLTLDGVMQAPGGPEEDPSGGFEHGGWSFGYWDEQMQRAMGESMSKPFDLVLGRKTYEIFAAHWPHSDDSPAEPLNKATKHVASTTLTELEWENSNLIEGDVPDGVRALKQQDGPELQVHGSANLIQTLLEHGLIDEVRLWTFPLVLGKGKRLFDGGTVPAGLELTNSQVSSTGVTTATYRTGAEIKSGSFAAETPSEAELARRAAQER